MNRAALPVIVLASMLSTAAWADKEPAPKEWDPMIDAVVDALKKGDAKAIIKQYGSFAEIDAACPGIIGREKVDSVEKRRAERAEKAVKDCAALDWKVAKRVSTEGGGPKNANDKCAGLEIMRDIHVTYEAAGKTWRIKLDGLAVLKGKRMMMESPSCRLKTEP